MSAGPRASRRRLQLVKTGKGKALMDEIRKVIGEMQSEEKRLAQATRERPTRPMPETRNGPSCWARSRRWCSRRWPASSSRATSPGRSRTSRPSPNGSPSATSASRCPTNGRSDEVGVLARTFDRMTQSLRAMAGAAEQIAAGDLRSTIKPQSPNDVLGNAFARMTENLREQIRAVGGRRERARLGGQRDRRLDHAARRQRQRVRRRGERDHHHRGRSPPDRADRQPEGESRLRQRAEGGADLAERPQVHRGRGRRHEPHPPADGSDRRKHGALERAEPGHRPDHRDRGRPGGAVEPAGGQRRDRGGQGGRARQGLRRGGAGSEESGRAVAAGDRAGAHDPERHPEGDDGGGDGDRAGQQGGGGRRASRPRRRANRSRRWRAA